MNYYLKNLIVLLSVIITIVTSNFIVLWLLLFILTFINFWSDFKKLLYIDIILIILLAVSSRIASFVYVYKLLFVINIVLTLIVNYSIEEKKYLRTIFKHENKSLRNELYEKQFNSLYDYNQNIKDKKYSDDVSFDSKLDDDLERRYLQSRIRFYGYSKDSDCTLFKWSFIDILIFIFVIIVFVILIIIGR